MKTKTSAALLLTFTFILGTVAGAVSYYLYETHGGPPMRKGNRPPPPRQITEQLASELRLDADQKERLAKIIGDSREKYRALSVQFRPQYDAIRDETRQQIRTILRDDQKAKFEEVIREMDARSRSRPDRDKR